MGRLALALLSSASLGAYCILVQRTKGLLSEEAILYTKMLAQTTLCALATGALEPGEWRRVCALPAAGWCLLAAVALAVQRGASLAQQVTIRRLGAPLAASLWRCALLALWPY